MDKDCIFCKIISGEIPAYKIYEDNDFLAFLDINPINLGHSLVIPKIHCRNIFDMSNETLGKIGPIIQKVAIAIKEATSAEGINIGWNNEGAAGQLVFHSHTHIMPRFSNDGFAHWHGKEIENKKEFEDMQKNIKSLIDSSK